jgi:IclR family transcriptional regulator, KDG regulon repressor
MKTQNKRAPYRVQVLDRTFEIINTLAETHSKLSVTELAARLGLHKSTAHRLLMVLESNRFVERDKDGGKYHLGSRIMELGLSALSRLDVCEIAKPYLRNLVEEAGETAHMGVLRGGEVVSVVNVESSQTLRTPATVGTRTPVHCTSLGKAIMAFGSSDAIDIYLRDGTLKAHTPNTITSIRRFREELRAIQIRGYAIDNEEREEGLRCIGAPVHNCDGEVIAAISIAGPAVRILNESIPALSSAVMETAARISASLGYHAPKINSGRSRIPKRPIISVRSMRRHRSMI